MRRYQLIDFCVFALLLCLLEAVSAWALAFFPGEAYTFSLTLFVCLLMTARWGGAGMVYAALGGAVYCFVHGGQPVQYAVYVLGNSLAAANLLLVKRLGVKRLRESAACTALYCLCGYALMCLGRAGVSWIAGEGFWLVRFLAVDALSAVVTLALLMIARKQNGLFEPQREYLIRLRREEEEQKHGQ